MKIFIEDINPECKNTIFFIHSWPLNHNMYEYIVSNFSEKGYRCIAIDLRGYENLDKPSNGYHYDRVAKDIRCIIQTLELN